MKKLLIALGLLAGVFTAPALTVDTTVSDHCVLLQNAQNVVKGTTTAGRTVGVRFSGGTTLGSATADSSGKYQVSFNPGSANATGRDLVVSDGVDTQTISDVLVGEVWLVAGQSNAFNQMDPTVMWEDYTDAYPGWKAQFECPNVRVVISTPKQAQGGQADYYQAGPLPLFAAVPDRRLAFGRAPQRRELPGRRLQPRHVRRRTERADAV